MRRTTLVLSAILAFSPFLHAQEPPKVAPGDLGKPMAPSKALNDTLDLFEMEFIGAAKTMPAEKYGFAPSAAVFVPSQTTDYPKDIRTFRQQVIHVTQANYFFFSAVLGTKPTVDVKAIGKLTNKEELLKALQASFVYAHQAVNSITPDNAFLTIEGADGMHTRATVVAFAIAHGYDHYGQMVEYLRMNGLKPPAM